jgi:class 3 adenylate cyclase
MPVKILVVDDDAQIRNICTRVLRQVGYEVYAAVSGEQGVQLLAENWDVVLTDLSMPGRVDGIEMLRRTRAQGAADVLIMTATPELDTAIKAIREGAYDYLVKPVTQDTLLMAVKRCVQKRELSQELRREKMIRAELDRAYQELTQMGKVKETFGQFVTPEVVQFILSGPQDIWKKGERKVVTILFADVRRFTSFAENVPPEQVVEALNEIFRCVTEAVRSEGGILNKFIGDGMLALFGAPLSKGNHEISAARAAIRAQKAVDEIAESRKRRGLEPLRIGIGVNTGEVVAGCLGTEMRAEYSVIGHAVNLAARLESESAPGQILLGPETVARLSENFKFGLRDPLLLPGIAKPVIATELLAEDKPLEVDHQTESDASIERKLNKSGCDLEK